jgi:uncharacterized RDD family membrane protein YckC
MELEDRHVTSTPEGVSLSVVLAGAGSRVAAYTIDFLLQLFVIFASAIILGLLVRSSTSGYVVLGVLALIGFTTTFGYFVLFETFDSGRSLGKRAIGIRVTRSDGSGVTFRASLVRNLMRVLYAFPVFYVVDGILILATSRNQRLGDLLAGTIVVRERFGDVVSQRAFNLEDRRIWGGAQVVGPPWGQLPPQVPPPELASWDVTAVSAADMAVVSAFLMRRWQYDPGARQALGLELEGRIRPKVGGAPGWMHPEAFLEAVALLKSARG